jgi:hypothetical protein
VTGITKANGYQTSDGQFFGNFAEAKDRQRRINLRNFLDHHGVCRGGEWDASMILDVLDNNAVELLEALNVPDIIKPFGQ